MRDSQPCQPVLQIRGEAEAPVAAKVGPEACQTETAGRRPVPDLLR